MTHSFKFQTSDNRELDSTMSINMNGDSWGFTEGVFFPLLNYSEKSIIALYIGQSAHFFIWKSDSVYTPSEAFVHEGITMQFGLPIGFDFKYGGEAMLDKGEKISTTVGLGLMPSFAASSFSTDWGGVVFRMPPYVKLEFGAHALVNWKFRVMYNFGDAIGFKQEDRGMVTRFRNNSGFTFSLLMMPFSWDWGQSQWW